MKPVLALSVQPEFNAVDPDYVADLVNHWLDREFGPLAVSVRALTKEDDLRAFQAGELVLYRKPARRHGNKIVYERDGVRHELVQEQLFGE